MSRFSGLRAVLLLAPLILTQGTLRSQDAKDRKTLRKALAVSRKIDSALKDGKVSPASDDGEFLRRVTLDLTGRLPLASETQTFIADTDPERRSQVIDRLLASAEFADLWSRRWCRVLVGTGRDLNLNIMGKNVKGETLREAYGDLGDWLREQIDEERPWSAIVNDLLCTTGVLSENPQVLFKALQYREGAFDLNFADTVSKTLLGVRISCARCHDHPFDRWTQEDYYGLAAFFRRVQADPINSKGDACEDIELKENEKGEMTMPGTDKQVAPRFLTGSRATTAEPRLPQLARFMTSGSMQQFSLNLVNRTWAVLMDRGFVEPLDDFNRVNKPLEGGLMTTLASEFTKNDESLKFLVRAICNSEAYQRSCTGGDGKPFHGTSLRPLTGEQLYKSLRIATDAGSAPIDFKAEGEQRRWKGFLDQLGNCFGARRDWSEVTPLPGNTPQVLLMRNSDIVDGLVRRDGGLAAAVADSKADPAQRMDRLFWAILIRPPTNEERDRYMAHVKKHSGTRVAYEDVVWALVNSAEFSLRH